MAIISYETTPQRCFGSSLFIDGNNIVVGVPRSNGNFSQFWEGEI